jgi:hypothetical protein
MASYCLENPQSWPIFKFQKIPISNLASKTILDPQKNYFKLPKTLFQIQKTLFHAF